MNASPWTQACLLTSLVAWAAAAPAWAASEPALAPAWVTSAAGDEVVHTRAKMAWARCAEGMRWQGKTCTGEPMLLTHAQALALAKTRAKADGLRWRLPRVTELQKLTGQPGGAPGLDAKLFPAAPAGWHWAQTANVHTETVNPYNYGNIAQGRTPANANHMDFLHGWAVNLGTGEARGDELKRHALPVRLVRTLDTDGH